MWAVIISVWSTGILIGSLPNLALYSGLSVDRFVRLCGRESTRESR